VTTYDPRNMLWDNWCSLMAELFAAQELGTLPEDRWREWGDGMAGIGYFMNSGVPSTHQFATWQEWAENLVGIMSI